MFLPGWRTVSPRSASPRRAAVTMKLPACDSSDQLLPFLEVAGKFSSGVAPGPPVITALFWGEHAIGRAGFIPLRPVATPPDRFPGEILFRFPSSPLGCEGRAFAAIAPQRTPKTNPGTATPRQAAGQGARRNSADQPRRTTGTSALFPVSPKYRSASKDYNPPRRGRFTQSNSSRSADRRKNVRL